MAKKSAKPMTVAAIANQKGGVGKTTLTTQTAFLAAEKKLRVLVVEFDSQVNATQVLWGDGALPEAALTSDQLFYENPTNQPIQVRDNIWLIPATDNLVDVDDFDLSMMTMPRINLAKMADQFDLCLIDTPPGKGRVLYAGLTSADKIVCPCTLDTFAINGLIRTFEDVERVRLMGWNENLEIIGVQINKMIRASAGDQTSASHLQEMLANAGMGEIVNKHYIFERAYIRQAINRPAWETEKGLPSKNKAGQEIRAACDAILKKLSLTK